jgi:hypothetical protein
VIAASLMGVPHRNNPSRTAPRRPNNHNNPTAKITTRNVSPLAVVQPVIHDLGKRGVALAGSKVISTHLT